MPNKSRRVASRQARLSGRGRRTRPHGPSGIPAVAEPQPEETSGDGEAAPEVQPLSHEADEASEAVQAEVVQAETPRAAPVPVPRSRARALQARPIETYFRKEMLHIGIASAVVFAVLAVLAVVLS